jgi:endonuclease YncB( thermonuclease family)
MICRASHSLRRVIRLSILAALWFILTTAQAAQWIVEGWVVALSDGDTVTVLDSAKVQHKVRIAGIDAPEKGQPYGNASTESLSRLVFGREVAAYCYKKDRYGREVCRVFQKQRDVGLEQIRAGMAWHFKEYQHEQTAHERLIYRDDENAAKAAKQGAWKDPMPVPPWEWRRAPENRKRP